MLHDARSSVKVCENALPKHNLRMAMNALLISLLVTCSRALKEANINFRTKKYFYSVFLTSTHTITKTNWNEVKRHLTDQSKSSVYKSDLNPSSIRKIFSLVYCSGSGSGFVPFFVFWMSKLQRQPQLLRQLLSPEVLAWKNIEIEKPLEREPRLRLCGVFWIACQYSCERKLDQLASY